MRLGEGTWRARLVAIGDPARLPGALGGLDHPFAMHSGGGGARARWSFFGADPFEVHRGGDWKAARARWRALAGEARSEASAVRREIGAPFTGGAVGYWAYDFGRRLERLPSIARDDLGLPDFVLALYDVIVALDGETGAAWILSSGLPESGRAGARRAEARLEEFAGRIEAANAANAPGREPAPAPGAAVEARSTFSPSGYRAAIEAVKDHIARGDLFQANLSQRWTARLPPEPPQARAAALFEAMTRGEGAPFAAWFGAGDHAFASASPERFLEVRDGRVETRPIKGTRPRGAGGAEDTRLAAELLASTKDRAENVMIVDVLRNDLGRVCVTGSVETTSLCELEIFPHVFHLTSTVTGRLQDGLDALDLLEACFPGGSITGAPKIRAMEILDRLEPVRRHLYTGSFGYLDWGGDADWSILIRTALVTLEAVHFAAGGGITADSEPEAEHEETLHKAEAVRSALAAIAGPVALGPGAIAR